MANPKFVADLETTTKPEDCRVWGWGFNQIGHDDCLIGTDMDRLMEEILYENCTVYFHNLKFDGEFIIIWLYEHGYDLVKSHKKMPPFTFTTLISDKGQFYSITIKTDHSRVTIRDSLKILPFKVAEIAKGFGLPILKGEIDYDLPRPPGYQPTEEEKEYIRHDVLIVCQALEALFEQGLTSSTQAANAIQDYKNIINNKTFQRWFPIQPIWKHDELAQSYRGGFTWANPIHVGKTIQQGIVLDKNSMYPWVMQTKPLPMGDPVYFEGKYEHDSLMPLYIQQIKCQFELKPDRIPTIQIKYPGPWSSVEYLTSSTIKGIETEAILYLTNIDLQLFLEQYEVYNLQYIDGYKFRQSEGLFTDYINKWYKIKEKATREKNKPMRQIAKLMLNALYGKFGTSPHAKSKYPYYDQGKIIYRTEKEEDQKDSIYVPMAAFITSYAREECIRSAQACFERFLYADTDSLHLIGLDIPDLDIDSVRLGAWKCEGIFRRGKYIRSKTYVEEIYQEFEEKDNTTLVPLGESAISQILQEKRVSPLQPTKLSVTCAGLPANCHDQVTFDNFVIGASYQGKLLPHHVKGGIVLMPTTFDIKGLTDAPNSDKIRKE